LLEPLSVLLEEGNHAYFTIYFGNQQQVTVVFKEAEKNLPNPPRRLILPVLRKHVFQTSQNIIW